MPAEETDGQQIQPRSKIRKSGNYRHAPNGKKREGVRRVTTRCSREMYCKMSYAWFSVGGGDILTWAHDDRE